MSPPPGVTLRARTDDDLDGLFAIAGDLDTWEERNPSAPTPLARHAEVGISLATHARGRGIGTAALLQVVEFGFARRNLRRLHLQAIASDGAAIRSYEKAGFAVEGRLREHAWVRGGYEDIVLMGILR